MNDLTTHEDFDPAPLEIDTPTAPPGGEGVPVAACPCPRCRKPLVDPRGLWWAAVSRLPRTQWPVYLLSWGLSLVVCAALVIGGFRWWVVNSNLAPERPRAVPFDLNN